jgi:dipeptidyl-peptidase-3
VPAGINIPNYDDIRQTEGFKNVSLGNVLAASYGAGVKPVTFITEADQALFKALKAEAFEVQVGIHELLGHGSGKLFHQGTPDVAALVAAKALHPITGEPITGPFYPPNATWDSTFGKIASAYEECRAENSGLFLCLEQSVLDVFGHVAQPDAAGGVHDITYINWLLMCRAGLVGELHAFCFWCKIMHFMSAFQIVRCCWG